MSEIIYREIKKSDYKEIAATIVKENISDYKKMHRIYHELLTNSGKKFDGILTLFAVTESSI